jgi:hypothetical protein
MKKLFFAAALIATPASSYSNNDIFLECNITTSNLAPSELTEKSVVHYRVTPETSNIWRYDDRVNTYLSLCTFRESVKCELTKDRISFDQNQVDEKGTLKYSFGVNRWNGEYFGFSDIKNPQGKSIFTFVMRGGCEAGVDQTISVKKF